MNDHDHYGIKIGSVTRRLPILEVAPNIRVAVFNLLGDWELTETAGQALAKLIPSGVEALLMPDGKAQALLHVMGRESKLPTFVARKEYKAYMGVTVSVEVKSITTARLQVLHLSEEDYKALHGKRIAFVDDVVSTGGTLEALKGLAKVIGATHAATLAVFTEGTRREDVIALGHLPLFGSV
jgi:adenine phosphoribosyltransferase